MSISLELKSYGSADLDVETWRPRKASELYFVLDLRIGETGDERADLFYVTIASQEALLDEARRENVTEGGPIIFSEYSLEGVLARVREIVARCESDSWRRSVVLLQRHFQHEYADYAESDA